MTRARVLFVQAFCVTTIEGLAAACAGGQAHRNDRLLDGTGACRYSTEMATRTKADTSRAELRMLELAERRDAPATLHLLLQITATLLMCLATLDLAHRNHPLQWLAMFGLGIAVLTFFPLLHETGHQTAFANRKANEVGVWLGALFMLQAPSFFREFHWAHHRSTQKSDTDPEISGAPALLDGFPGDPFTYLFLVSGQFLMVGKLGFTIACSRGISQVSLNSNETCTIDWDHKRDAGLMFGPQPSVYRSAGGSDQP